MIKTNNHQTWLIAYDIRCPKRLRKIHKFLSQTGHALQYSLFAADLTLTQVEQVKHELSKIADASTDDVRMYQLSQNVSGNWLGPLPLHSDINLHGSIAGNLALILSKNPLA